MLNEIQKILESRQAGHSPCHDVREILQNRVRENKQHLKDLIALQDRMEKALLDWADMPDGEADDPSFCPLIESVITPE